MIAHESEPLNLALLGTGRIAERALAPAFRSARGVRLWSVLSRDEERARSFAEGHGAAAGTPAFTDLSELLADSKLDGVIVATPDKLHADQTIAAARAGKHVLVEKPMATSSEDARVMVETASQAGVRLGVAYHLRWHAGHREMKALAEGGKLGELRHVRAQWAWPAPDDSNWRARPEVGRWWSLAGVGTHCLDLIRWFLVPSAGEVTQLEAVVSRSVWRGPHDETATVALRFESGATAEFTCSVLFGAPSRLEVYGASGYAIATGTLGPHGRGHTETNRGPLEYTPRDPYVGELEDFAESIRAGRSPAVDGEEGLRNVELLERASP